MRKMQIPERMKGILFIIMAGGFFSLMTLFIRLSGDLPTVEKAFFRNAVALVVSLVLLLRSKEGFRIQKGSFFGLLMRSLCGCAGLVCNFYAIDRLGLADANMLNKLSPFFALLLSIPVLKEKPNKVEWLSVVLAFIGAIFVIKPSAQVTSLYGLVGLIGGMGAGFAYAFVRKLGKQGERGPVIVFCFSLISTTLLLPFFILQFKPMQVEQLLFLLLTGLMASGGQFCITAAYTYAPAKEISVFDYSQILFAAIWGGIFFHEVPDLYSLLGYVLIIGVAIFKWWYGLNQDRKVDEK